MTMEADELDGGVVVFGDVVGGVAPGKDGGGGGRGGGAGVRALKQKRGPRQRQRHVVRRRMDGWAISNGELASGRGRGRGRGFGAGAGWRADGLGHGGEAPARGEKIPAAVEDP